MMDKVRARAVVVVSTMLSIAAPAFAAPPAGQEAAAEAARLDALAAKLGKSGAAREALAALRQSQALSPKRATLGKIAALQRQSNDFAGAYATYVEIGTRYDGELKPKDRADLRATLDELRAITGGVHVKVVEPGAHVEVDGVAIGDGPVDTTIRVNLGVHSVKVSKPRFDVFEWKGDVAAAADVQVVAELKGLPGSLSVRVKGPSASVRVDGKDVGPAPWRGAVPPGRHVIEAGEPGQGRKEVEIVSGEEVEVELEGDARGRLAITVEPPDAEIAIDGQPRAKGVWEDALPPGAHDVVIALGGFDSARLRVFVTSGKTTTERVSLKPRIVPARFDGFYGIVAANFAGAPVVHNFAADACASDPNVCEGGRGALGAEIPLRLGYSLGYLGIEGVTLVRFDQMNLKQEVSPIVAQSVGFTVYRITVANGVEARFMPKFQGIRPSAALGIAWSHQVIGVATNIHGGKHLDRPSAHGDAPMFLFDAGVLFGQTPGAKFRIAIEGTVEPTGDGIADPAQPTIPLARGTVFFLGPSIGAQFGH